jgi:hypothetical protein
MDDFHLNLAVYQFEEFIKGTANPHSDAEFHLRTPHQGTLLARLSLGGIRTPGRGACEAAHPAGRAPRLGILKLNSLGAYMSDPIRRELRLIKGYAIVVTLLLGTLSVAAFRQSAQKTRFTEIDVERINIVEPDGALRMVISNRPRSIGPVYKGKPFGYPGGAGRGSSSSTMRARRTAV